MTRFSPNHFRDRRSRCDRPPTVHRDRDHRSPCGSHDAATDSREAAADYARLEMLSEDICLPVLVDKLEEHVVSFERDH